jgi:hypothetical protein
LWIATSNPVHNPGIPQRMLSAPLYIYDVKGRKGSRTVLTRFKMDLYFKSRFQGGVGEEATADDPTFLWTFSWRVPRCSAKHIKTPLRPRVKPPPGT